MIHSGAPFAHTINFSTGLPTGAIVYSLLGNDGLPIAGHDAVSVTPTAGALSHLLVIPGSVNTVATPLFETRTLTWYYSTTTGVVTDRIRYRVEKDFLFPATVEGVRRKLGVEPHEISDSDIDLLHGYSTLAAFYADGALDAFATAGNRNTLLVTHAIEAAAALAILPSMQLAVAKKESSGTNTYERFGTMDWGALEASLIAHIGAVNDIVEPLIDPADFSLIFFAVSRATDAVTGETNA